MKFCTCSGHPTLSVRISASRAF